jgi:cell division protein FtsI (penicillin-binding protein 3)
MTGVRRFPVHRLLVLLVAMVLAFSGIVVRLATLQVKDHRFFEQAGFDQRLHTVTLPADRGEIRDRTGSPLAITLSARDVYADPSLVTDPVGEAAQIAEILEVKPKVVLPALTADGTFAYVARQVDESVAAQVEALSLPGIGFLEVPKRYYPADSLAAQVDGFVGVDGVGLSGLEAEYEDELAGTPGERVAELGQDGQPIPQGVDTIQEPVDGATLVTTIDRQIQFQAQRALRLAVEANQAKAGTVVVLDPRTGDVLAMASSPSFDPNRFSDASPDRWRNRAVTDAFEPGSVAKTVTAAAAIESGAVSLTQRFHVPDQMRVGDYTIHDSHPHPIETMTLGDIVAESSNIGIAKVAQIVGPDWLDRYLRRFGFGRTTGIGFPGETAGDLPAVDAWTDTSLATFAYGQGFSVSALQMACVYATIANDGVWVRPRLVRGTIPAEGSFDRAPDSPSRRVLQPATARILAEILSYAVADGTGAAAAVPGYQVAGKTGTALKPDPSGGYLDRYVASFIGFLPSSDPRVVVAAFIDEPTTIYGSVAAAPLFQDVARYAIQRLGIAPADPLPLPPHTLNTP